MKPASSRRPYSRLEDVPWEAWTPEQHATLLFVVRDEHILLIHKKRGLGVGKINGPGGRIEPGESALECAIRETQEELCVTPTGVTECGELRFQFTNGLSIHGTVFRASGYQGDPQDTEEATPLWTSVTAIPYERMWADDILWLPLVLEGRSFRGRFLFDEDVLLDHHVQSWPRRPSPESL